MTATNDHRPRTLFLSAALHAFTHVYQVALIPLYLLIWHDLDLDGVGQATSLVTVMMISYFLPSYLAGVLADKFSKKHLLSVGLAVNGLGFIGLAQANDYSTALGFVILAGLGGSLFHPAATSLIARLYPECTGRAIGLLGIGAGVGFLIGPIYSGWRAEMLEPMIGPSAWRKPVFELGLAGLIMAFIFNKFASDSKSEAHAQTSSEAKTPLFPTTALWAFFIGAAFFFGLRDFTGFGMGSLTSLFLQKAHNFDTKLTGSTLSIIFLAASLSNLVFGRVTNRFRWTAIVLVISAVLVFITPMFPAEWIFAPLFTYGLFFMGTYPMIEAVLMEAVPDNVRGRVFGFFITIGGCTGSLAPWVLGEWVKNLGDLGIGNAPVYQPLYGLIMVTVLISLFGLPCLRAIQKREKEEALHPHSPTDEPVSDK
jgi:MFS transporter, FSR family, fosmidomycin resistance protein